MIMFNDLLRTIALLLLSLVFFTACHQQTKGGFTVSITYKNADKMITQNYEDKPGGSIAVVGPTHILLEEIPYGGDSHPVLLDSALLNGKEGKINLQGNGKEEGIYQLVVEKGPVILVINDVEKVNVEIDLS